MNRQLKRLSKGVFAALDSLARPLEGPRLLIYHQIGGGSGLEMEVGPGEFRRQIEWLRHRFLVTDLDTALQDHESRAVVITFDDGYRSVYEEAFPFLAERDLPFTLYLTTQPVEEERPMRDHPGAEPLTWEMLGEMLDSGLMTLGAHTHSHPDLRGLGPDEIEKEVTASDDLIEQRLGLRVNHFAYPWGYWSPGADDLIRRRYRTAALGSRLPRSGVSDPHLRYRLPIQLSDTRPWFECRVRRGLLFEESVRRRINRFRGPET